MKKIIILGLVLLMVVVFATTVLAKAEVDKFNEKWEIGPEEVYNDCTGEWVELTGTFHINGRVVTDSAGGFHFKLHENWYLVGVGLDSGTEYIGNVTFNEQFNEKGDFPFEQTVIQTATLVSKGEEPNLIMKARYHITINVNGDVTVYFDEWELVCK